MKQQFLYGFLVWALLLTGCAREEMPTSTPEEESPVYVEGELLVKFTPEVTTLIEQAGLASDAAIARGMVPTLDEVQAILGACRLERIFPVDRRHEARTREEGLHQWYVVRFASEEDTFEVAQRLSALGEVQLVAPNRMMKRAYTGKATPMSEARYNRLATRSRAAGEDPLFGEQWNLVNNGDLFTTGEGIKSVKDADVQVAEAWKKTMGNEEIIVAILDEGVYVDHPDLRANMWRNPGEIEGSTVDNDGNGYAGDVHGYNFIKNMGTITTNDIYDSGHGTHVAGVISAVNNNGEGIRSIAGGDGSKGGVRIMSCQLFSGMTATTALDNVRAIKYAADNGAVVLQCSWGMVSGAANIYDWGAAGPATQEEFEAYAPLEKVALDYFVHHAGSPNGVIEGGIAVFAAGNESAPMSSYPGADPTYISVAATAADFTPAVYTNYGPGTAISAPGGDQDYYYDYVDETHNYGELGCILSTVPYHVSKTGYAYMEGTSMACPHVSGVLALALSHAVEQRRHLRAEELKELLYTTATPIDSYMTGTKKYYRYVADLGTVQPMQMPLGDYRGQMGVGQVNATALLAAIDGAGLELRFPNLYLAVGAAQAVSPARYFKGGDTLTYTLSIADESIATSTQMNGMIYFQGLQVGATTAEITASNGEKHAFTITVRSTTHDGWL